MQNLDALRADTPGCTNGKIFLNNAGSSIPPRPVTDAMQNYLAEEALNGGYETVAAQAEALQGFYCATAELLNTHPRNVAFATNATDAYNKALSAILFEPGDVLLTTDDDYVSNQIAFLFLQKRFKVKVLRAEKLPQGGVDIQSMQELMDKHSPKLVAVTHVPTNSGLVQDVAAVGRLCRERDIWYLVDACQSAGQMPLDMEAIGCDFLSATLRKWLRGPRGTGFLFASDKVLKAGLEPIFPDMHGAIWTGESCYELLENAQRFEYFEKPFAAMMGSKIAVEYALDLGLENIEARVGELATHARQVLANVTGVRVLDRGERKCGIVTAAIIDCDLGAFKKQLNEANISYSISQRHVAVIDFEEKGVEWALRVSPHYFNTKEEIDRLGEVVISDW